MSMNIEERTAVVEFRLEEVSVLALKQIKENNNNTN